MNFQIDDDILKAENVVEELFYVFYLDEKERLENLYLSSKKNYENFTLFCIEEWRKFDDMLFTD